MSSLSEIVQGLNDRTTALEDATLDENLILPKIEKIYEGISITAVIRVTRAVYYLCGEISCGPDQKNTREFEETVY